MNLEDFGWNDFFEKHRQEYERDGFEAARVIAEHRERYIVKTTIGEFDAEVTGNLRYNAESREDFPAVGDWVAISVFDSEFAVIHKIFPRLSVIKRKAVGHTGDVQIIAVNIDFAFLVQAVDRDFSINRLERYLTICNSSKVKPLILLTKTDLIDDDRLDEILGSIKQRIDDVPVIAISNETQAGYENVKAMIEKSNTYCMLGSSGVGKSTLLNNLSGKALMKTDSISESTNRGKHVTTHRELIVLENGGLLIDNPGMREVGIADSEGGLEITFDKIFELAEKCKFKDCTHTVEAGCEVIEAVVSGVIEKESYDNFMKMEKERKHFESTAAEKRKKDKRFGKMMKNYKKDMKRNS